MKQLIGFILCCLCMGSALGATATDKVVKEEFKCYLDTSQGEKLAFFRWRVSEQTLQQQALSGTKLRDSGGTYYIKQVHECVLLSDMFSSAKAKALDAVSVR